MAVRISHHDYERLQASIVELYELRRLEELRRALPEMVLKLVPGDYFGIVEVEADIPGKGIVTHCIQESSGLIQGEVLTRMERTAVAHPFTRHVLEKGFGEALMLSDFWTEAEVLRSELYNEFYQRIGVRRTLAAAFADGQTITTVNSMRVRGGREYTERDRAMLTWLSPHIAQACRNAIKFDSARTRGSRPLANYNLTPRETEVAVWIAQGKTNPEIATILGSSPRTVEKHVQKVLEKFGVENRTAAAVMISDADDRTFARPSAERTPMQK